MQKLMLKQGSLLMLQCRFKNIAIWGRTILMAIILAAVCTGYVWAGNSKRVLLIASYHPGFPTFFRQVEGVKSVFDSLPVQLDVEFMDSKRFYTPENLNRFYKLLKYKLSQTGAYDVIMTADDNALSFVLEHKAALFVKTPIVFFGVNSVQMALAQNKSPGVTGMVEAVSMQETLDLMVRLHPGIRKIIALVDNTPSGQGDLRTYYQFRTKVKPVVLSHVSLAHCTFDEFAEQLRKIDERSAVLLLSAYRDMHGRALSFNESLDLIRSNLSRPIYHLWDHGLGRGVIGGNLISHYHEGMRAARMAADILEGKNPAEIPVKTQGPNQYMFDLRELQRFDIKLSALPSPRTIVNLPDTFYTRHKTVIWFSVGLIIAFALIIFSMSLNILRRIKAENALKEARDGLERKVRERTLELGKANEELQVEIRERRQAQKAMRENERKYRALVETTSDWIWEVDQQGVYTYSSPKAKDLLGYEPEEIIGRTPFDFMPEDEAQRVGAIFEDKLASGEGFDSIENTNLHKDGRHVVLETSGVPIYDAQGTLLGYRGVDRDITQRVEIEKQLHLQAQIIQQVHDSVISTDMDGVITSWNKGSEHLFRYTAEEALGRHVSLIYPKEYHRKLQEEIIPTLVSRGSHGYESTFLRKGGETFSGLVSLSLLKDEKGELSGLIGYTLDISGQKRLEQEREKLIRELKDALAKIETLSGFLPICASCKKIRDDKGYWNQIETYIREHSKAEFSHSICPDCAQKLYPGLKLDKGQQD